MLKEHLFSDKILIFPLQFHLKAELFACFRDVHIKDSAGGLIIMLSRK